MITIALTLNVQLDAADLAAFDARLAAIARGVALLAGDGANRIDGLDKIDKSYPAYESHSAQENPPTAPNAPKRRKINPRPPRMPASPRTPVLPPVFSATMNGNEIDEVDTIDKSHLSHSSQPVEVNPEADAHPSAKLPFAEFDKLVRSEMKRLSMDGRLPGHKLWNNERDPRLPTMAAILLRYGTTKLTDLAALFGLEPPLSAAKEKL